MNAQMSIVAEGLHQNIVAEIQSELHQVNVYIQELKIALNVHFELDRKITASASLKINDLQENMSAAIMPLKLRK